MQRLRSLWERVRGWKGWRHVTAVRVIGALLLVGVGIFAYVRYAPRWDDQIADSFIINILTDMLGIVFAVLVIDGLNERRANRERKRAIIQQMGSPVNDAALEAVRLAKIEGWDKDGSLRKANLSLANLQGAHLPEANLQKARLGLANLQGAVLVVADLQGTVLDGANLQGAVLDGADLQGAHLSGANLQGVDLFVAILKGATLTDAKFDDHTTLPDSTNWTPDTNMSRFTDPNHPEFWRSDNPDSPAYRGDDKEDTS